MPRHHKNRRNIPACLRNGTTEGYEKQKKKVDQKPLSLRVFSAPFAVKNNHSETARSNRDGLSHC